LVACINWRHLPDNWLTEQDVRESSDNDHSGECTYARPEKGDCAADGSADDPHYGTDRRHGADGAAASEGQQGAARQVAPGAKPAGVPKTSSGTTAFKGAGKKPSAPGPAGVAPQARSAQGAPHPQGNPPEHHGHKSKSNFGVGVGVAAGILATILAAQAAKSAQEGPPTSDGDDELARQCRRWDRLCEEEGARWACRKLERECN